MPVEQRAVGAVGGLLGLSIVVVLPWVAATGAPPCTTLRAGEACVEGGDGAGLSGIAWVFVLVATFPLLLLVGGDLRRIG